MIKKVDSTPTRMLDREELIKKIYELSDEVERLNNHIEQLNSKIQFLKKLGRKPKIKFVEKIVHVYDMNYAGYKGSDLDKAMDFTAELTGLDRPYIMQKRRTEEQVIARSIVYKILYSLGYSLKQIGRIFNKHHTNILNGLQKYENVVPEAYKYHTDVYISNRDKE